MIPLPSTILAFLCSLDWFAYGLLLNDPAIFIPNGLGIILSIINLTFYVVYRKKNKENNDIPTNKETTVPSDKNIEEKPEMENFEKFEVIESEERLEVKESEEKLEVKDKEKVEEITNKENNESLRSTESDKISIELQVNSKKDMKNTL